MPAEGNGTRTSHISLEVNPARRTSSSRTFHASSPGQSAPKNSATPLLVQFNGLWFKLGDQRFPVASEIVSFWMRQSWDNAPFSMNESVRRVLEASDKFVAVI